MKLPGVTILLAASIIFSCSNRPKYIYATLDFSDSLKPHLEKIIENGIAGYDSSTFFLTEHATDSQLQKLSLSEHPVLRMVALKIMQQRDSLDPFRFVMSHLDDRATVAIDEGEFGVNFRLIPDALLDHYYYRATREEKSKIVEKVLLKYNYLRFAYYVLDRLEPDDKYYQSIKEMVQRDRPYEEIDLAVYALAKFKKQEDIKLITHILYENKWNLGRHSFMLMQEYPNSDYLNILALYAKAHFSTNIRFDVRAVPSEHFFNALASYKRKEAAELLPVLLNRISRLGCYADTSDLKISLFEAFLENKCEAYSSMLPQIELNLKQARKKSSEERMQYK